MTETYLNVAQSILLIFGLVVAFICREHCLDHCRSSRKAFMLFSILLTFNQLGFLPDSSSDSKESANKRSVPSVSLIANRD